MKLRRPRTSAAVLATVAFAVLVGGCESPSMLDTHGSEAQRIAGIWWLMFGLGAAVYSIVAGLVVWAVLRRRTVDGDARPSDNHWIIWGGVVMPVVVLAVLAVVTVQATAQLRRPDSNALRVEVVGKRWWWQVSYPGTGLVTANEIHLAAGRPAEIGLDSDNVIHSFWVPQLAGKLDLIPGQHNTLRFTPKAPGSYLGECAEFCGIQHARMDFLVIVQTDTDFERWLAAHRPVPSPPDAQGATEGEAAFVREPCAGCHAIRGTPAQGTTGPDLTDFGERSSIGARTIENTPQNLAKWIVDAQNFKPGALMPPFDLSDRDVSNIVSYLESLK